MLGIQTSGHYVSVRDIDNQAQIQIQTQRLGEGKVFLLGRSGQAGSDTEHLCIESALLHIIGCQIFNFASREVLGGMCDLQSVAGVQLGDSDAFLLHRGERHDCRYCCSAFAGVEK